MAAGALVGSFFVEPLERHLGRGRTLILASATFPLFSLVPAVTADAVAVGTAGFFLGSALNIGWNVITVSLRQRIVPDHLLGRVNAGYRLLAWGTMPLGAALGGFIGERYGVTTVFWTSTVVSAVCIPLVVMRRHDIDAAGAPATEQRQPAPV